MKDQARFGEFVKSRRLALGYTLRQFCNNNQLDAGNFSKLERGMIAAPKHATLMKYARALRLEEGTNEWLDFFDLAAADRGQLPEDLRGDAELLRKLPVLFRGIRSKDADKLDEFAERLRNE